MIIKRWFIKILRQKSIHLSKFDIIGFGFGSNSGKLSEDLFELGILHQISGNNDFTHATCNGTFTSRAMNDSKSRLQTKGFDIIREFKCKGFTTYGHFKLMGGIPFTKADPTKKT